MANLSRILVTVIAAGSAWMAPMFAAHAASDRALYSPSMVEERIKPQAKVCVEGDACATAAPVAAAPAGGAARPAEQIFNNICAGCHMTGAAGAPKVGDAAAWAPRIAQGKDTLAKHALAGFNMMPVKGTCGDCSDDEIKSVIDLMVSRSK